MKKHKIPKKLQGVLWSVDVKDLDLEVNKAYIINQILCFGRQSELKWLFKTYSRSEIKEVFLKRPSKIYLPSAFNFCKKILLDIDHCDLPLNRYVRSLPRSTG